MRTIDRSEGTVVIGWYAFFYRREGMIGWHAPFIVAKGIVQLGGMHHSL